MDKTWIDLPDRLSSRYVHGIEEFIAYTHTLDQQSINCPCRKCINRYHFTREVVKDHLMRHGFLKTYRNWTKHGEAYIELRRCGGRLEIHDDVVLGDQMIEMVQEIVAGVPNQELTTKVNEAGGGNPSYAVNEDSLRFFNILDDANTELYPGCQNYSRLSFIVELLHLKVLNQWTNRSFDMLLELLRKVLPDGANVCESYYEACKLTEDLGFTYETWDACPKSCMLFRNEHAHLEKCLACDSSRWKPNVVDQNINGRRRKSRKLVAAKQVRYFPLKPRLKKLFISSKTANLMRWHAENNNDQNGKMTHPCDSPAWKDFDRRNTDFAADSRNIRLGLAADGVNPFGAMNVTHSTWPVVLIPYNLPPWLCMKQPFLILSVLIDGPKGPGDKIDVYLQPLIEELQELWNEGVMTFDAAGKEMFNLRAALLWTINDFPAYANLSGWSTKGKFACPACNMTTQSRWLRHGKKFGYMGHRRFLPSTHRFRRNKTAFDGNRDFSPPPKRLSGDELLSQLISEGILTAYRLNDLQASSSRPNKFRTHNWKKRSIFFELPYWKDNLLMHNLDVMHIEKNVCDNLLWTILSDKLRSKDNANARRDLEDMGLRHPLHLQLRGSNRAYLPPAQFTMSTDEKELFLSILKGVRVPDGYCSNISRRVNLEERTLSGLKSHDGHILMQQLIPIAIRRCLSKKVVEPLIELSNFFRQLCSRVCRPDELQNLKDRIALTLCHLETIFPPNFFDVMVHLTIHLADEAMLGGPVQFRWMYPIERYLKTLKQYVRNRAHPEASIAKGYLMEECTNFCAMYMGHVETKLTRPLRIHEGPVGDGTQFNLPNNAWVQAHRYVLFNTPSIRPFIEKHLIEIRQRLPRAADHVVYSEHFNSFHMWFKDHVNNICRTTTEAVFEEIVTLSQGPFTSARCFRGCDVNGFHFRTKEFDDRRATQNSGVAINADTLSFSSRKDNNPRVGVVFYYGLLTDVIEIRYNNNLRVLMFKCDWVDPRHGVKKDDYQFTLVNFNNLMYKEDRLSNEPYILASQAKQVYFVEDRADPNWHVAIEMSRRGVFQVDFPNLNVEGYPRQELSETIVPAREQDADWVRETVEGDTIEL